ncbi:hypothetical protein TRFO_38201 [Tritrichomonas foetus]|uniref:Uncharacterized protein n=1 Tax=Tritrichomonas foetus TaxID=1144522 RepID=A0A1J4J941_9EUKA|nr:hypothetical protein TRFO_38201 [Tritrichomonas foetus]|eukprot:OHS95664.1 hypothetical protein TRFO_38201 [Tritrichomonas foetus]
MIFSLVLRLFDHSISLFYSTFPSMISGHFTRATDKCSCGNIHVSGKKCDITPHLGVSRSLLKRMSENTNKTLQLRSASIGITNLKTVVCQKVKNNVYYISCVKCNQVFVVYVGRGSIYGQFSNDLIKDRLRLSEAMLNNTAPATDQFPSIIYQLVRVDEITRESAVDYNGSDGQAEDVYASEQTGPASNSNNHQNSGNDDSLRGGDDFGNGDVMFDGNDADLDYDLMFADRDRTNYQLGSYQAPTTLGIYM